MPEIRDTRYEPSCWLKSKIAGHRALLEIIGFCFYPPPAKSRVPHRDSTDKRPPNDQTMRRRYWAWLSARRIAQLRRRRNKRKLRRNERREFVGERRYFKLVGGSDTLVNSPRTKYFEIRILEKHWDNWRAIYYIVDKLMRQDASAKLGQCDRASKRRAIWLVLKDNSIEQEVSQHRRKLEDIATEAASSLHLIAALVKLWGANCKVAPTLTELSKRLSKSRCDFFGHALHLQRALGKIRAERSSHAFVNPRGQMKLARSLARKGSGADVLTPNTEAPEPAQKAEDQVLALRAEDVEMARKYNSQEYSMFIARLTRIKKSVETR